MGSRVRWVASVGEGVVLLHASWSAGEVAAANELDGPGLLHLGKDAVVAVNAKETLLAAWSPDHLEEVQLCEVNTGVRRVGLAAPADTELVHLEFLEPRGYLRGVTRSGQVLVWRGRESPEAVELEGSRGLVGCFAFDSSGTYLLHAGDSGELDIAGSVWNLESGERVLAFAGIMGLGGTFSPDGKQVVLVTPEAALVGDLQTKEARTVVEFSETVWREMVRLCFFAARTHCRQGGVITDCLMIVRDGRPGIVTSPRRASYEPASARAVSQRPASCGPLPCRAGRALPG